MTQFFPHDADFRRGLDADPDFVTFDDQDLDRDVEVGEKDFLTSAAG
jgi:hypothetical protein